MISMSSTMMWRGPVVMALVEAAADEGTKLAAEHLLHKSREIVPYLTGTLSRSGAVTQEGHAEYAVSYDTPYAVRMHEDLSLSHRNGRKAKYLEGPAVTEAHIMFALSAVKVSGVL